MQEYSSKKKNREAKLFEIIRDNLNTKNYSEFLNLLLPSESSKLEDTPVALRNVVGSLALQEGERLLNKYDKCNKDSDRLKIEAKLRHLTDNVHNLLLNRQQWIKVACLSQLLELDVEGKLNCFSPKDYLYYREEQVKPSIMQRLLTLLTDPDPDRKVGLIKAVKMFPKTERKLLKESLLRETDIFHDLLLSAEKKVKYGLIPGKDYLYYSRAEQVKPSIMLQRLSTAQQVSILEVLQMFSETELKLPQESLLLEPEILNDLLLSSAKKVQYRLIQGALFGNIPDPQELEYLIATELASIKNVSERVYDMTIISDSSPYTFEGLYRKINVLRTLKQYNKNPSDTEFELLEKIVGDIRWLVSETIPIKLLLSNQATSEVYANTLEENLRPIFVELFREDASSLKNKRRTFTKVEAALNEALKSAYYNAVSYVAEKNITLTVLDEITEASSMKQLQKMLPGRDVPSILRSLGSKSYVQLLEFLNSFEIPKNAICTMDDLVRISDSRYNTLDFVAFLKERGVQAWFLIRLCEETGISPGLLMKKFNEYQRVREHDFEPLPYTLYEAALGLENLSLDQSREIVKEINTKFFPNEVSWRSSERPFFMEREEAQVVAVEPEPQPQAQPQPDNREGSFRGLVLYGFWCAGNILNRETVGNLAIVLLLPILGALFSNEQNFNQNQR